MRAAIILAAGSSRRFGRRDKLREKLAGRSLLDHALANAKASDAHRILLVTSSSGRIPGTVSVRARHASSGLSASLSAGLAALRPIEREALIFLADMPYARAPRLRLAPGVEAVRPVFRGQPGHPMLVRTEVAKMRLETGDRGLAGALRTALISGSPAHILDIDTWHALGLARRHGSRIASRRSQKH